MTWVGLLVVTLGWGFVLSYPLISPLIVSVDSAGGLRDPARFIPMLGENAIVTGFGIAILGIAEKALRYLNKMTGATNQTRAQPKPSRPLPAASNAPIRAPSPKTPMLMPQRTSNEIVTRGALNGRDYVLFRDGSVVVETLLGPRRFPSIGDAQEFIGAS
jgi:hypothetical protein